MQPKPQDSQISPNAGRIGKRLPSKDLLDVYLDGIEHLPPTPALMVKLLAIFKQADPNIDDVVQLIAQDPSLTAEVLKRCNSAYYGSENRVSDIFGAVSRLGFYEVYRLVVMISGARTMALQAATAGLPMEILWQHSLATAVAAGVIAVEVCEPESAAFTAGLLHDVGKIVLASAEGAKYGHLAQAGGTRGGSLVEAEKKAFGFDHSEVGGQLLARWGLPTDVVTAIRYHHDVVQAGEFARLAATVAFADVVAHSLSGQSASEANCLANGAEAMAVLNLARDTVTSIIERVQKTLERDAESMIAAA